MNSIHPSAIISGAVTIGTGNTIGAFVVITGPVSIGDDNWIGTGVVLGAPPEVRSFEHPRDSTAGAGRGVIVGDRNIIREYAQIHQGWHSTTVIADESFIMNQVYIAHDCRLGDGVTLASSVLLAGHTGIGAGANLGLGASVHQRTSVGTGAMIGMGSVVTRDVPPFGKAYGNPARLRGVNATGMERSGLSAESVAAVAAAYAGGVPAISALRELALIPELAPSIDDWLRRIEP